MATEYIIEEEALPTQSSDIAADKKYYPISIESDGETFKIENNGTAAAPCRVTIIPKNDIMLLTIEGLSEEKIEVEKIKSGQRLVIDGIDKTITLNGDEAFDIYKAWEFPKLQPGTNTVKITNADVMTLSVEYQPRYI